MGNLYGAIFENSGDSIGAPTIAETSAMNAVYSKHQGETLSAGEDLYRQEDLAGFKESGVVLLVNRLTRSPHVREAVKSMVERGELSSLDDLKDYVSSREGAFYSISTTVLDMPRDVRNFRENPSLRNLEGLTHEVADSLVEYETTNNLGALSSVRESIGLYGARATVKALNESENARADLAICLEKYSLTQTLEMATIQGMISGDSSQISSYVRDNLARIREDVIKMGVECGIQKARGEVESIAMTQYAEKTSVVSEGRMTFRKAAYNGPRRPSYFVTSSGLL